MKELTRIQNICYALGGILLLIGAVLPLFTETVGLCEAVVFAVGAVLFSAMQLQASYEGTNFVVRRLRRQQLWGAVLLLITAILLFNRVYAFAPLHGDEWKITLALAALFEVYTAFRIPAALDKEKR